MSVRAGADDESDDGQEVCSDVEEALYLLTKRDPVVYDRATLTWTCSIPAKSRIETRFGKVKVMVHFERELIANDVERWCA